MGIRGRCHLVVGSVLHQIIDTTRESDGNDIYLLAVGTSEGVIALLFFTTCFFVPRYKQ